jgi:hypothetical protein
MLEERAPRYEGRIRPLGPKFPTILKFSSTSSMPGEDNYGTGHPLGASFVQCFEDLPLNRSVALQEPLI